MSETNFTFDVPKNDLPALTARLRNCNGQHHDYTVLFWEECQFLVGILDERDRLRAGLDALIRFAGNTIITDGDTTCTLGWYLTRLLEGKPQ